MERYDITDPKLGRLVISPNRRAKRLVFRAKSDGIYVTVPEGCTTQEIERAVETLRDRLSVHQSKLERAIIEVGYTLKAPSFELALVAGDSSGFFLRQRDSRFEIMVPRAVDLKQEEWQEWLRKVILEQVRKQAQKELPRHLALLAHQHGFQYQSVKINSSRTRWGSCSGRKSINLSLFLVLLPEHLMNYVLLHELCHTQEMNHGPAFWNLMDRVTKNQAKQWREELKGYRTELF